MKDLIREFNKSLRFIYLLAAITFVIYLSYVYITRTKKVLKYKFNGIVEKIIYDPKGDPLITIKGETYYLSSGSWNFNHLISKGDSLEKDSGNITVKLIKHKNGRVLVFDGSKYYEK